MWSGRGRDHGESILGGRQRRKPHEVDQQVGVYVDGPLLPLLKDNDLTDSMVRN